jgi:putative transposase
MILSWRSDSSIQMRCAVLGVLRSSFSLRPSEDRQVREGLTEWAGQWPTSGYRRLTVMLRRHGLLFNAQRVRQVMQEMGLCAAAPARRARTTDSNHPFPRYPNVVEGLEVTRPDQVRVADFTDV